MKIFLQLILTGMLIQLSCMSVYGQSGTQTFAYDATGNRVSRTILIEGGGGGGESKGSSAKKEIKEIIDNSFIAEVPMRVYPNPTKGQVRIDLGSTTEEYSQAKIIIYDLGGRKIVDKWAEGPSFILDLSIYANGTYILHVIIGDIVSPWRIIKR